MIDAHDIMYLARLMFYVSVTAYITNELLLVVL